MKTPARTIITTIFVCDQVSLSEQVKENRNNFCYKKENYSLTRIFPLTIDVSMLGLKKLAIDGLIDSFSISNGTIKIKQLSESQPVSITHLSDLGN